MRILLVAANPRWTPRLQLEEEIRELRQELRSVTYRDAVQFEARQAVRPDDLVRLVRELKPDVVHFSSHGSDGGLTLSEADGGDETLDGDRLARFFEGRGVSLVVFNACYSADHARRVADAVKTVIGTSDELDDDAGRRFSIAFYRSVGNGETIEASLRDARDALELYGHQNIFQTYGRVDYALIDREHAPQESAATEDRRIDSVIGIIDRGLDHLGVLGGRVARIAIIATVIGLALTLWWSRSYPNTPMTGELYTLFAFAGVLLGTGLDFLARWWRNRRNDD